MNQQIRIMATLLQVILSSMLVFESCAEEHGATKGDRQIDVAPTDWPWWRGPDANGIAPDAQKPLLRWGENEHVLWKSRVPGRGHGSPTVVGDDVFLAAAEMERNAQSVICYDRKSGKQLWQTDVHRGGLKTEGNKKASLASATVACDGKRLFVNFLNNGAVFTTALTRTGEALWQKKITDYVVHQGYGSSPALFESLVLVSADNKGGGAVAALDRSTGKTVWKVERPATPNYASPIVTRVADRLQLVLSGCNLVMGFDPSTGKVLWQTDGSTTECVTSTVTDGNLVFTSGGYPKNHVSAIRGDGTGSLVWENNTRVYVPSMLVHEGYLYAVSDPGIAICWNCETGQQMWKHRLGGTFTSSLVLVGNFIYATNEEGVTFIFKASPRSFELTAKNQLGDEVFATPAICGNRIYARIAQLEQAERHEWLYCLGRQ